jgi:signal transduction histidine kinase
VLVLVALISERETVVERLNVARLDADRARYLERRRLERDLHDGVQQRMLALLVGLRNARRLPASKEVRDALGAAEQQLKVAMSELRDFASGAFPATLVEVGLAGALQEIATRSSVAVDVDLSSDRLEPGIEAVVYFVVSEAVTNAQKHARPSVIRIGVHRIPGAVRVSVTDDGIGFAEAAAGTGLTGLRERVESYGGTFEVESRRGEGTTITATIPASDALRVADATHAFDGQRDRTGDAEREQ